MSIFEFRGAAKSALAGRALGSAAGRRPKIWFLRGMLAGRAKILVSEGYVCLDGRGGSEAGCWCRESGSGGCCGPKIWFLRGMWIGAIEAKKECVVE